MMCMIKIFGAFQILVFQEASKTLAQTFSKLCTCHDEFHKSIAEL